MGIRIAVIGATGKVGYEILNVLSESDIDLAEVLAVSSHKSAQKEVSFGESILISEPIDHFDFSRADIAIFGVASEVSAKYAPIAASKGCIVIDNSSHFRMDPEVPLVVPEVNSIEIGNYIKKNIISNPNCCAIPLVLALHPLHQHIAIERVVVSTYQSVSGAGRAAMDELYNQTKAKYMNNNLQPEHFSRTIAFNVQPVIGEIRDNGYSEEEWKIRVETQKILDPSIIVDATCVRVPVFVGHSESVMVEFADEISVSEAVSILKSAPGVQVNTRDYDTPIEIVGEDDIKISRIRQYSERKNTLNMWIVSDNLRKGAALNAVQIAKHLINYYF